jgi:hypothetical protein
MGWCGDVSLVRRTLHTLCKGLKPGKCPSFSISLNFFLREFKIGKE